MTRHIAIAATFLLLISVSPLAAHAHGRSTSTSTWRVDRDAEGEGGWTGRIEARVPFADLEALLAAGALPQVDADPQAAIDAYLARHLALHVDGARCERFGPVLPAASDDTAHQARGWRVRCEAGEMPVLHMSLFREIRPQHLHLARVEVGGGTPIDLVFAPGRIEHGLAPQEGGASSSFAEYLVLGVEHISSGYDHLAFLLALLLVGTSLRELAVLVTGFTLAHSITLSLGVLGVVRPEGASVEALIGLSIVVVALENFAMTSGPGTRRQIRMTLGALLVAFAVAAQAGYGMVSAGALLGIGVFSVSYLAWSERAQQPARLRWFVAFTFGLVHGFGFAGLLVELGLPPGRIASSVLGFNLGVELGQLAIVALAWPLLRALARHAGSPNAWVQVASTPILALGLYWFLSRALG